MSTNTGQSSKPTVPFYFNPERIYVIPDLPTDNDPLLASGDPSNEDTKDTRYTAGCSFFSVLKPTEFLGVEWGTAKILTSVYGAGKGVVKLRADARERQQNQPHDGETANDDLLSRLKMIDCTKSNANTFQVTIIGSRAPKQTLYEKRGFRKHTIQELEDLEYDFNKRGTRVDGGTGPVARRQTFTPRQQADTVEIFDDGETW